MAYNKDTEMWEGYIYKIFNTNGMTDKVYIGQTILTIEERWKQHQYRSKTKRYSNIILYNYIRKYELDNFDICVVEIITNKSQQLLIDSINERESYYIDYYNSLEPNGLNITKGGDYNPTVVTMKPVWQYDLNGNFIKEFESVQEAYRSFNRTHGNISNICRGKKWCKTCYGYLWNYKIDGVDPVKSDYQKVKLIYKDIPLIKRTNKTDVCRKPYKHLYKFDLDGNLLKCYDSVKDALIEHDIKDGNRIYATCKEKRGTYAGFLWSKTLEPPEYNPIMSFCKKVVQYDLGGNYINTFNSMTEASIAIFGNKKNNSNIGAACCGKHKTCGGFIWKYAS